MLARYQMLRGRRPPDDPLPDGVRIDTRKHTKHCLRPSEEGVARYLAAPGEQAWRRFSDEYLEVLASRFAADRRPFDELAAMAADGDVYIGCSCPTKKNPDVRRCHTVLALEFMRSRYPELVVELPRKR